MSKQQYLEELRVRLKGLSQDEIEDALSYCEEYFDDAGEGRCNRIIADLGSPYKFAAQIRADAEIRRHNTTFANDQNTTKKSSLKSIIAIILGICALPIALPLLLALVAVIFALFITIGAFAIAGLASVGAIAFTGFPLLVNGFYHLETPGNALIAIGGGLLCIGLGILLLLLFIWLIRTLLPAFMRLVTNLYHKAKEGKHYEKA